MLLNFTKMHGLGNDFVFVDDFNKTIELSADQVAFLCDRHFGIGADGVVLVRPSDRPECVATCITSIQMALWLKCAVMVCVALPSTC